MKYFTAVILGVIIFLCKCELNHSVQLERLISFQSCRYDEDCSGNSFCYGNDDVNRGKCRCKENYILMDRNRTYYECVPVAEGIDSPCSRDIQCQVNLGLYASCSESRGMCQCREDAHLGNDNQCYRSVGLGDRCDSDHNCLLGDGTFGYCVVGKCSCNINHHPSEDRQRCVPTVFLGKSCLKSESCIHTFADCFGGICKCIAGYIESEDNRRCLKAASTFGENCTESTQCFAYLKDSFCNNGTCICQSAHHGYGNECVMDAKLGDRCNYDKECILNRELLHSVRCTDGVCTCIEGVTDQNSYGCVIRNSSGHIMTHFLFSLASVFLAFINY